jgi:nitrogen fixation/metabolism regulation signal transduction histidine kinase
MDIPTLFDGIRLRAGTKYRDLSEYDLNDAERQWLGDQVRTMVASGNERSQAVRTLAKRYCLSNSVVAGLLSDNGMAGSATSTQLAIYADNEADGDALTRVEMRRKEIERIIRSEMSRHGSGPQEKKRRKALKVFRRYT